MLKKSLNRKPFLGSSPSRKKRLLSLGIERLEPRSLLAGDPVISEFMADNKETLRDADGDSSDWIEVFNPGDSTINLSGWHLTDNAASLDKWTFPAVDLAPLESLIVFASGKNRIAVGAELHTNFKLNAAGEYLALVRPDDTTIVSQFEPEFPLQREDVSYGMSRLNVETPLVTSASEFSVLVPDDDLLGQTWTTPVFDDTAWTSGQAPVGFFESGGIQAISRTATISNPPGATPQNTNAESLGQSFSPKVNDGLAGSAPAVVSLERISFFGSTLGSAGLGPAVYLNIYSEYTPAASGGVPGFGTPGGWVGSSVDPVVFAAGQEAVFDMGQLELDYGTTYFALFSTTSATGDLLKQGIQFPKLGNSYDGGSFIHAGILFSEDAAFTAEFSYIDLVNADVEDISISNASPNGIDGNGGNGGQSFTPNVNDGFDGIPPETVLLDEMAFVGSASPSAGHGPQVYLNIYDSFIPASGGGVPNLGSPSGFVGSSSNSVIFQANQEVLFGFEGLELDYDQKYFALFSTTNTSGDLIRQGVKFPSFEDTYLGGDFIHWGSFVTDDMGFTARFRANTGDPVGIATSILEQMQDVNASAYIRTEFEVADPDEWDALNLRIRYDDGFVAYLNGAEIARRNAPQNLSFDSVATAQRDSLQAIGYEDLIVANLGLLNSGTNVLAIQGLNVTADDREFWIQPELTGIASSPLGVQYFSDPTPGLLNSTGFEGYVDDTKFSVNRGFFDAPMDVVVSTATSGATIIYTLDGSEPSFSNGVQVPSATPDASPAVTVRVEGTTTLRAAAFKAGYSPTNVDTQTYIFLADTIAQPSDPEGFPAVFGLSTGAFNGPPEGTLIAADYELDPRITGDPVWGPQLRDSLTSLSTISIVTEIDNLFDQDTGIYFNSMEKGIDWEVPASIEWINPDGSSGFQINAGLRIQGGESRRPEKTPKKGLRILFKDEYGPGTLDFPLFPDSPVESFDKIVLRSHFLDSFHGTSNGSHRETNQWAQYIVDEWARQTHLAMGGIAPSGTFANLYINGLYWGLYSPVERPDGDFMASHLGGEKEDWDVVTFDGVIDGSRDDWDALLVTAAAGLSDPAAYAAISEMIDVPGLIDYLIVNMYGGNGDWPNRNWITARNRNEPGAKWKFVAWDEEEMLISADLNVNKTTAIAAGTPTFLYGQLLANEDFRRLFGDRLQKHFFGDGVLAPKNVAARYQVLADQVRQAVIAESARWGDVQVDPPYTLDNWEAELARKIDTYFPQRTDIVLSQFASLGLYPNVGAPSFLVNGVPQEGGEVASGDLLSIQSANSVVVYIDTPLLETGAPGRVLVPTDNSLGTTWTAASFVPDAAWTDGSTGNVVGYEDGVGYEGLIQTDVGAEMRNKSNWALLRTSFTFDGDQQFDRLALRLRYDDGFIAYLNGTEIARSANAGSASTGFDVDVAVNHEADSFEEFDITEFRNLLTSGTNVLAIHGVNRNLTSSDFLIMPELVRGVIDPNAAGSPIYYTVDGSDPRDSGVVVSTTTFVDEQNTVRVLVPSVANGGDQLGISWTGGNEPFSDDPASSAWVESVFRAGVGYDTETTYDQLIALDIETALTDAANTTAFIRTTFDIGDQAAIDVLDRLTLRMKYDDAFVAYINGTKVAMSINAPNPVEWNSVAETIHPDSDALVFQDFIIFEDPSAILHTGTNVLAIQGINQSLASSDMLIVPQLLGEVLSESDISDTALLFTESFPLTSTTTIKSRVKKNGEWSSLSESQFVVQVPLRITELMYNPIDPTADEITAGFQDDDDFEYLEILNPSTAAIDLAGYRFTDGIDYTFGEVSLAAGERGLVVRDIQAFEARYGAGLNVLGEYGNNLENSGSKKLSNGGETVRLEDPVGIVIHEFAYDDQAPLWPEETDGGGFSMVVINRDGDYGDGLNWRSSSLLGGSPGSDDPSPLASDLNGDLSVGRADIALLVKGYGRPENSHRLHGDTNRDGKTNLVDLAMLQSQLGSTSLPLSPVAASQVIAVDAVIVQQSLSATLSNTDRGRRERYVRHLPSKPKSVAPAESTTTLLRSNRSFRLRAGRQIRSDPRFAAIDDAFAQFTDPVQSKY